MRHAAASSFVVLMICAAGVTSAQSLEWRYGGRASWVNVGTTSEELGASANTLEIQSGLGLEFDATLMISDRFAVEFSIGVSAHRILVDGDEVGEVDAGRLMMVPLTAIAHYHFPVYGPWDPYAGLGVSWSVPFSRLTSEVKDLGIERMEFDGQPAFAVQLGVNYQMDNRWYANVDLRYFGTSLDARIRTDEGDLPTVELEVTPLLVSLGFGYKF